MNGKECSQKFYFYTLQPLGGALCCVWVWVMSKEFKAEIGKNFRSAYYETLAYRTKGISYAKNKKINATLDNTNRH